MDRESNFLNISKNPKKRVLFVITQSELGGAQRFLLNLVKNLDKEKYEPAVALGKDGNFEVVGDLEKMGVPVTKLKHARRGISLLHDFLTIFEIRNLIRKINPDVLFLNSSKTSIWGPLAVYFPSTLKPTPRIIYRIGGWSFNDPQPKVMSWLWTVLERLFAKYKDIIIVNNKHDFEQAQKLKIKPRESLKLIYNGIDLKKLDFLEKDEAKIKLFEKLASKPGNFLRADFIIGTIANFYKTKGLEYLIEAIGILKFKFKILNFHLVIIGDGEEKSRLESRIKELKLENTITLAGKLPDAYKYLKAFDIFVLPSVKEGFPWAILEAMAAKLPIVATTVGAIPEIIENGKNGLTAPSKNPKALAETVKTLFNSEKMRQEFSIQAHQTVLFKFELEKMVKQIEALF